ncbi:unnamed protein product, partial [Mesorhabditis spiculigera]
MAFSKLGKSLSGMPEGVEHEIWYHGLLPREDINTLLKEQGQFLLRQTEPAQGQGMKTVLSVFWDGKPRHFIINKHKEEVLIEKHRFPSVGDLVRFHQTRQIPVTEKSGCLLMNPVPRQEWELRHDSIKLGKLLGEGAFGGVYAGEMVCNDGTTVDVAVKVHKGKQMTKNLIKEICKEARIMRRYEHKNIVNSTCASTLPAAWEYLHERGCIHRDVAARNCLVSGGRVKISDFGLSREMSNREARYKLKDLHQRLPIRWLAPETLRERTYTTKTDVYSFGVLMWEVFENGAIPYPGMTVQEVNIYVREGNRLPDPDMMPIIARDVMRKKCFPENPEERSTMGEIREALEKFCRRGNRPAAKCALSQAIGIDLDK